MIDEYVKNKLAPATKQAAKSTIQGAKNALIGFGVGIGDWFRDFRWIEFTTAVTAAFAAGVAMGSSLMLKPDVAHKIGLMGAGIGAICYIRSPKTKWEVKDEPDAPKG